MFEVLARILPNSIINAQFPKIASGSEEVNHPSLFATTYNLLVRYVGAYELGDVSKIPSTTADERQRQTM